MKTYPYSISELVENRFRLPTNFDDFLQSVTIGIEYVRKGEPIVTNRHILGREVIVKQLRTNTNLNNQFHRFYVIVLQCDETKIEEQTYYVTQMFKRTDTDSVKEIFDVQLWNLKILQNNEIIKIHLAYDYAKGGYTYQYGTNSIMHMGYQTLPIYDYNHPNVLKNSELKYTKVWEIEHFNLELSYKYRHMLEMLLKNGCSNLWGDVAKGYSDMRKMTKGKLMRNRLILKKFNPDHHQWEWLPKLLKYGLTVELSMEVSKRWTSYEIENQIKGAATLSIETKTLMKYLLKQNQEFRHYNDYLEMMIKLNTPVETNQTMFPKDLKKAHDDAVNKYNTMKHEFDSRTYSSKILPVIEKLEYTNNEYAIIVPKDPDEILKEGKALDHCVGSYIGQVLKGETIILFIRMATETSKPLYTMEFKDGRVNQIRGIGNKSAPESIKTFADQWRKKKGKLCKSLSIGY